MAQAQWDHGYACGREDAQAGRAPGNKVADADWRAGYDQGYTDHAPRIVTLHRRSRPDQLRYLAAKLREGEQQRVPVSLALEVLADELTEEE